MHWTKDWYDFRDGEEEFLQSLMTQHQDQQDIDLFGAVVFPIKIVDCQGEAVYAFYDSAGVYYDYVGENRPKVHATHVLDGNRGLFKKTKAPANDTQPLEVEKKPESEGDELFRLINCLNCDIRISGLGEIAATGTKSQAANILWHLRKLHASRTAELKGKIKSKEKQLSMDRERLAKLEAGQ